MADKAPAPAPALAFCPAPRPQRRLSPEEAEQLSADTADLGFGRATSTPAAEPAPAAAEPQARAVPPARALAPAPKPRPAPILARPKPAKLTGSASLKFDIPADLWTAMKVEAAQRRVTVKFLVLEALSKQGFTIDLDAIPEDGRRLR